MIPVEGEPLRWRRPPGRTWFVETTLRVVQFHHVPPNESYDFGADKTRVYTRSTKRDKTQCKSVYLEFYQNDSRVVEFLKINFICNSGNKKPKRGGRSGK